MRFVPLNSASDLRLLSAKDYSFVEQVGWLPLGETEFHLASHFLPVAFHLDADIPSVGVLLDNGYQVRPLVDTEGKWLRGYQPIALRCLPFRLANARLRDPALSLEICPDLGLSSETAGQPMIGADGRVTRSVAFIHDALRKMRDARGTLAAAIDQLVMADLLVPMPSQRPRKADSDEPARVFVVDGERLYKTGARALSAMARQSFLSMDLAMACLFSQRLLKAEFRPGGSAVTTAPERTQAAAADAYAEWAAPALNANIALDDTALFSTDDLGTLDPTEPLSTIP
jgi:hypothetical protein